MSLLPQRMLHKGIKVPHERSQLQDAQGKGIRTFGRKRAQVELCHSSGRCDALLEDDFVVASVSSPLISLGRLTRRGWRIGTSTTTATGMILRSPDGDVEVPIHYKKNSLAVEGVVRAVEQVEGESEISKVWTVVELKGRLYCALDRRGWYADSLSDWRPHMFIPQTREVGDPLSQWSATEFPFRTSLIRHGSEKQVGSD